jgi:histone deacetylase 8
MGQSLSLDTEIPDHKAFPLYAHSFTLDVPAGNMQDQNTEQYVTHVELCFEDVFAAMKERMSRS